MQQLDLFNKTSEKKQESSKPEQQTKNAADDLQAKENAKTEKNPIQAIKPLSKKTEQKVSKRGRKSFKEINLDVALLDIPDDEILFQKQYYSITEVSGWFHVNTSLIRFWENEFDILKPRKNRKGDRLFRPEDVKNLQLIYYLLRNCKYSVEGARQYLKDNKK